MKKTTKATSFEKWMLGAVPQKSFPKNYTKFTKKGPVLESLSNTVKGLYAVKLANLLKRMPRTGILEPAVCKCSVK